MTVRLSTIRHTARFTVGICENEENQRSQKWSLRQRTPLIHLIHPIHPYLQIYIAAARYITRS